MCNINALYKKTDSNKDILGFLMAVTSNSFSFNNHGEGFYCDNNDTLFKSKEKINYYRFKKKINKSKVIITHQRLSTSGYEVIYNHPFKNKDFVFVHNGIINQFKKSSGSDSAGFFEDFNKLFNENLKINNNRKKAIVNTIKELFKEDKGSYSILIYDKKENVSYYFKDSSTSIYFYKNREYLFITTSFSNDKFLSMLGCNNNFKEVIINDNMIYKIKAGEVYEVENIREEKKSLTLTSNNQTSPGPENQKNNLEVEVEKTNSFEEDLSYLDDDINDVFTPEELKRFSKEDLEFIDNQNKIHFKKRVKFNNYEENFDYINKFVDGC